MSAITVEEIKMELDPLCQDFDYICDEENDDQHETLEERCKSKVEVIPKNLVGFFEFSGISVARGSQGPNKILKCLTCNHKRTSSGSSTGNFVTHLKTHPDVYKRYLQIRQQRKTEASQNRSLTSETLTKHRPQQVTRENFSPEFDLTSRGRADILDELLLKSVVNDLFPASLMNSATFRGFLEELDRSYIPPTAERVNSMVNSKIQQHRMRMSSVFGPLSPRTTCHLTCDLWTHDQRNLLFVKVHYIDDDWNFCRVPLAVSSRSSSSDVPVMHRLSSSDVPVMHRLLTDLLSQLGVSLDNVGTISINMASEILAVFANNQSTTRRKDDDPGTQLTLMGNQETRLPDTEHLPCIVHQLQTVFRTALEDCGQQTAITDLWTVVNFLRKSPVHAERLGALSKQPLMDRDGLLWDHNPGLLEWLIQVHSHLQVVLAEARRVNDTDVPNVELRAKMYYSELLALLEAFREACNTLQADGVTSSLVLPTLVGLILLERKLDCKTIDHIRLLDQLQAGLGNQFRQIATHESWTVATLLDPRFRLEFFRNAEKLRVQHPDLLTLPSPFLAESSLRKAVKSLILVPSVNSRPSGTSISSRNHEKTPRGSLIDSFIRKCHQRPEEHEIPAEFRLYLSSATEYDSQMTPLQFWANLSSGFPMLSRLARRYLSIPAAGSNLERMVETAGSIARASASGMETKEMEDILLLRELMAP